MMQRMEQNRSPWLPAWRLWQWLFPAFILLGFVSVAAWSIQFMRQTEEEQFRLESYNFV